MADKFGTSPPPETAPPAPKEGHLWILRGSELFTPSDPKAPEWTLDKLAFAEIEAKFLDSMIATLDRMISHANDVGRRLDLMLAEVK